MAVKEACLAVVRERDLHAIAAVHGLSVSLTAGSDPEHHGGAGGPLGCCHVVGSGASGRAAVSRLAAAQPLSGGALCGSDPQGDQVAAVDNRESAGWRKEKRNTNT